MQSVASSTWILAAFRDVDKTRAMLGKPMEKPKSLLADAASYWEPKRIVYNGVLAVLVLACWGTEFLQAGLREWPGIGIVLLMFAGAANALYCLAYPVDIALQLTPLKDRWQRCRWLLFSTGVILASILALWIMLRPGMA